MNGVDPQLIRERISYPRPVVDWPAPPVSAYEWKLTDKFDNKYGRWLYRASTSCETEAGDPPWIDVFGRDVHQSEFLVGRDFAVTAIADDEAFSVHLVTPPGPPVELFRQAEKLSVRALSADERFILVQSTQHGNWYRPELLVLDMVGQVRARLGSVDGTVGCFADQYAWAPSPGDHRIAILHESNGFFQPAIWHPFEDRVEPIDTGLAGELGGFSTGQHGITWDRTGNALILLRSLDGRTDLHRFHLGTRTLETLQTRDGTVFRHELDADNRVIGVWVSNHEYAKRFKETERFETPGFQPSRPLHRWHFRRIAGVPCFVVGPQSNANEPRWTLFDGYGMPGYHHADGYSSNVALWVDHGFQVVMVNTRGSGGFGRDWRESTLSDLGFTELEDMRRIRAMLIAEGTVDENRTIISGGSWGGMMTLLAMGTQPELWAMGLASAPVGDYEACHWEASPLIRAVNRTMFGGNARTHAAAYRKASPLTYVDYVRRPVFISTGRDDLLCPLQQNLNYVAALRARGVTCELHIYEGGHGPPNQEEREKYLTCQLEFALKHCRSADEELRH